MIKDKTFIIDLDNTIISTIESIINLNNKLYPSKYVQFNKQFDWFLKPMINSEEELSELFKLFDHKDFYKDVIVYDNAIEIINELAEDNRVVICSKHSEKRKPITTAWINKTMPKVEIVFVDNFEDKGKVFDNVFMVIDDKIDCLDSFDNDVYKICFGNYVWNQESNDVRCCSWLEVKRRIECIERMENSTIQFKMEYESTWYK